MLAAFLGAGLPAQPLRAGAIGEAFRVNTDSLPQFSPTDVAVSRTTGRFAVLWWEHGSTNRLSVRLFNPSGLPLGAVKSFVLAKTPANAYPRLLMDKNGRFSVVWYDGILHFLFFDEDGNPRGGEVTHSGTFFDAAAMDPDGNIVVVWEGHGVMAQRFDPDGQPQGDPLPVQTLFGATPSEYSWLPRVSMNDAGEFIVAWSFGKWVNVPGYSYSRYYSNLRARQYDGSGHPKGEEFPLTSDTETWQDLYGVRMNPKGGFTVYWRRMGNGPTEPYTGSGVFAQIRDASAGIAKDTFRIEALPNADYIPAMYVDGSGRTLFAWPQPVSGLQHISIRGVWLDPNGNPGSPFILQADGARTDPPSVAGDGKGDVLIAWNSLDIPAGSTPWNIYARRFACNTTTTVRSSANPVYPNEDFTLTADVHGPPGTDSPAGTVTFKDGDAVLGRVPLNADGRAVLPVKSLAPGSHPLTAEYAPGDSSFDSAGALDGGLTVLGPPPALKGDVDGSWVLWGTGNGAARLQKLSPSNVPERTYDFGPYAGWTADALSVGPDGKVRLLWNRPDGQACIFVINPSGVRESYAYYGPYAGWRAVDLSTGSDGKLRMLWTHTDGRVSLWTVNGSGVMESDSRYGPYAGWTADALAVNADGKIRLLWDHTDGQGNLWTLGGSGVRESDYSPVIP